RVSDQRLRVARTRTIEIQTPRSAEHQRLLAGHVVRDTKARSDVQHRKLVGRLLNALPGLEQAVGQIAGVRHERADRQRRVRPEQLTGYRILRLPIGAGAW